MDVKEGYRPSPATVKASDHVVMPGRPLRPGRQANCRPPEARSLERYAPGMGYPGDEGGGRRRADRTAATRRAALHLNHGQLSQGLFHHGDSQPRASKNRRKPSAAARHRPRAQPRRPGAARPRWAMGHIRVRRGDRLPRRIQRQSPAPGRRPSSYPVPARTQVRPRLDTGRLLGRHGLLTATRGPPIRRRSQARASRRPTQGPARTRPPPQARATGRPPRGRLLPATPGTGYPTGYPWDRVRAWDRPTET